MSQRASGYPRRPDEDYPTPRWVAAIVAEYLRCAEVREIWEPAAGNPALAEGLRAEGLEVAASAADFFRHTPPISRAGAIVTNPPYGDDRRATLACDFIRRARSFELRLVARERGSACSAMNQTLSAKSFCSTGSNGSKGRSRRATTTPGSFGIAAADGTARPG